MAFILKSSGGKTFAPHPESDGFIRGVIVDVTELKMMQTKFGEKQTFKIVYETEYVDENGKHGLLWSVPYTPSLNEKASFRRDLKKIRGQDITQQEASALDVEEVLLGFPVKLLVTHEQVGERTFAQITDVRPYTGDNPYKACGEYVRQKDRQEGGGSSYRTAAAPPEEETSNDWTKCKVHVGKYKNIALGELDNAAKDKLIEVWIPSLDSKKPDANDRRLKEALLAYREELANIDPQDLEGEQPF
jgi:hypothetical protein